MKMANLGRKLLKFRFNLVNALNLVGAAVMVYLLVTLIQTIKQNYDLNAQSNQLKSEISLLKDQNDELSYNIQYYKTDSFKQREARSKLGLQLPDEHEVVLPEPTAKSAPAADAQTKTVKKRSNVQQWLDFLTGNN
jgi:cell division protein FtsB